MVKLGIIGMSVGNGHPFSWSCIINGVIPTQIKDFEYPGITSYLVENKDKCIPFNNSRVVSVWCDNIEDSQKISSFSQVSNITNTLEDLVDGVDAVLLARDDSQNHLKFAEYCIMKGKPIFIDKPISTSVKGLNKILDISKYESQIFSCSALRYDPDLNFKMEGLSKVKAYTNKPWSTYSVHLLEPLIKNFGLLNLDNVTKTDKGFSLVHKNLHIEVSCDVKGVNGIFFELTRNNITELIKFKNPFISFRQSLLNFIKQINNKKSLIPREETLNIVKLIEFGK
tara:strand:+ start:38 stop:886 length:849 start_codon:yes stop_codon:yes gene_type:complete